ncbi:hypothetical protein DRJ25_01725 [Candidatus Woesearchaeota archaeon]|nr:MAG: hypothetical protein DRJ25_01725 [Candidatus Woesearchaeota archaeon]
MVLPVQKIKELKLVRNILSEKLQYQPAGVDFTIKKIYTWRTSGVIDFTNKNRILSDLQKIEMNGKTLLNKGTYLVEFNETVSLPDNIIGFVQTRSSLLRMGASVTAGFIDPGYTGLVLAILKVHNESGIYIFPNARIGQWRFEFLNAKTEKPYSGKYQGQFKLVT